MEYTYDLNNSPASFDFLTWLAVCATDAQGEFDLSILRGQNGGFRADDLEPKDIQSRMALLENVMLPATRLYRVRNLNVFPQEASGKRMSYMACGLYVENPVISMKAPEWAMDRIKSRFPVPPVVLCMRDAHYHTCRNSNKPEWEKVRLSLEKRGLPVVVVEDGFKEFEFDSLILRAALFEHARAVLGVNSGPMATLAALNERVSYCMFKPVADTVATSEEWWAGRLGTPPGSDFPWALPHQKIVWGEDTAGEILSAFDALPEKSGVFGVANPKGRAVFVTGLNTPMETMIRQAEENLSRDLPMFMECPANLNEALIVGGGPSLQHNLPNLRMRRDRGGIIFALNGTHDWLIDRGIVPDFHVMLDARQENVQFVRRPHKDVTYLIAAQCHPDVFNALKGYKVIVWLGCFDTREQENDLAKKFPNKPIMLVGGGATVGLKTMNLAYLAGFRKLHFYGFDSCYSGESNHAYPQPLNDKESRIEVIAAGKKFTCAPWMAKQAMEFQSQMRQLLDAGCQIYVHGNGLIPWIVQQHQGGDR